MLIVETWGAIRHLRLNRPQKRNALSYQLCRELTAALNTADEDNAIHAILLTAEPPAFCAGMDLKEVGIVPESEMSLIHQALFTTGSRLTTPLIASVNGPAVAGGTGLVANAHIAIAHPDAAFGLPEVRIKLWPMLVFRAVQDAIGKRRAVEWSLTGRRISALEAQVAGLVTEIHSDPDSRAKEVAEAIAACNREAISVGLDYAFGDDQSGDRARQLRASLIESMKI